MNPLFLKWGIGLLFAVVGCVAAYRASRRQQALLEPTFSSSFDGSGTRVCGLCLNQNSGTSGKRLVSLPCDHKFHECCIRTLFSAQSQVRTCPLCRRKVDSAFVATILKRSDF